MYDSVGKKITIFSNMILVALSALLAPYCSDIYPEYFLDRTLLASCSIIVMMNPLVNAYIKQKSRGQANSYSTLGNQMGSFVGVGLLYKYTSNLELTKAFMVVAIVGFAYSLVLVFFITDKRKVTPE